AGVWSFDHTGTTLADGTYNITAQATDVAGNTGVVSAALPVEVDTTAPSAPTVTITEDANNDGIINSAELSGDGLVDVSVALPGDAVAGDSITITDGTTPVTIVLSAADILAAFVTATFAAPASGSTITVNATITDVAGNVGSTASDSAVISTTSPTITIDVIAGDDIINAIEDNSPVTISGATANVEDGQTVTVNVNGIDYFALVLTNAWSLTVPAVDVQAFDPAETVTADVTDVALNPAPQATRPITYDPDAPAAPVVTDISTDTGISGTDEITSDNTLIFNGTAEANSSVEVFIDGVSVGTTTANGAGVWSFDHTGTTLADGTYNITAQATDVAGNTGVVSAALPIEVDTGDPAAPTVTSISNDTGASGTDEITSDNTLIFNGTAEANSSVEVFIDGVSVGTTTANGAGVWAFDHTGTTLADGTYNITAQATDTAGNTGVVSAALPATVETVDPTIAAQSFNYAENQTVGATVAAVVASDNVAVTGYTFTATGTNTSSDTFYQIDGAGNITITAAGVAANVNDFETGPNTTIHSVTVTDLAGNTAAANITLNETGVNEAPVNTVPGAFTVNEDTPLSITGLSIADVDAAAGSVTVTLGITNGTLTVTGGAATIVGSGTSSVTLTGTVADINATLASNVTYVQTEHFSGTSTLSMTTNDNGNSGAGGALADFDTVTINVVAVADAPSIAPTAISAVTNDNTSNATGNTNANNSIATIEGLLGVTAGFLDNRYDPPTNIPLGTNDPGTVSVANGTSDGSDVTSYTRTLTNGSSASFVWSFSSIETDNFTNQGYNDLLVLIVTDSAGNVVYGTGSGDAIMSSEEAGGGTVTVNGTEVFTAAADDTYTFSWVVVNGRDGTVDSSMTVNAPTITGTGYGTPIDLPISSNLVDADGSETLSNVTITGLTGGTILNQGTFAAGTWTLTQAELAGLQILTPVGFAGVMNLTVSATTTDGIDTATTNQAVTVTVSNTTNDVTGNAGNNTLNGAGTNDNIAGLDGNDTLNGNGGNDILDGGAGNDVALNGGAGNDIIYGGAGNDGISGGADADTIYGDAGVDTINGDAGDDLIYGGAGADALTGGAGADTFAWDLADAGAPGTPVSDSIADFGATDKLDLRDLLTGELGATAADLDNYLHFEFSGGDTTLHISSAGGFGDGNNVGGGAPVPASETQEIVFTGVDLTTGFTTDQQLIQDLLTNQQLITD
ncbi:MAG: beta strand repeat-containing protein, partial [Methylophilaceae bacterium]